MVVVVSKSDGIKKWWYQKGAGGERRSKRSKSPKVVVGESVQSVQK